MDGWDGNGRGPTSPVVLAGLRRRSTERLHDLARRLPKVGSSPDQAARQQDLTRAFLRILELVEAQCPIGPELEAAVAHLAQARQAAGDAIDREVQPVQPAPKPEASSAR